MNREELMKFAIDAGFRAANVVPGDWLLIRPMGNGCTIELQKFYVAARRAEREECAKMVDHILKEGGGTWGDAIRARGEK